MRRGEYLGKAAGQELGHRAATFCAIARSDPGCDMQRQLGDEVGKYRFEAEPPRDPKPDDSWFDAEIHIGAFLKVKDE
ncbi:MAG: hypothetical protein ACREDR_09080 [Blastocatellia bacterium]